MSEAIKVCSYKPQHLSCWEGSPRSGKTSALLQHALGLLNAPNTPSDSILILVQSSALQQQLATRLMAWHQQPLGHIPVYTYSGWIRNLLFQTWPVVENQLLLSYPDTAPLTQIMPELTGLEESEFLYKILWQQFQAQHPHIFEAYQLTDKTLIRQLIRRARLRSEHRLSRPEMQACDAWLGLADMPELAKLEALFDKWAYKIRLLDSNKQLDIFHTLLEKEPLFTPYSGFPIKHLLVDDLDETTPAQQTFIKWQAQQPELESIAVALDPNGGARRGYLNAHPEGAKQLKTWLCTHCNMAETLVTQLLPVPTTTPEEYPVPFYDWLYAKLLGETPNIPEDGFQAPNVQVVSPVKTQIELVDTVVTQLKEDLAHNRLKLNEIAWILPTTDALTLAPYLYQLQRAGIPVQLLSGTQRPADTLLGRALLNVLQLVNAQAWQVALSRLEIRQLLAVVLGFQQTEALTLDALAHRITAYHQQAVIVGNTGEHLLPPAEDLPEDELVYYFSRKRYTEFRAWLTEVQDLSLADQLLNTLTRWLYPLLRQGEQAPELALLVRSLERQTAVAEKCGFSTVEAQRLWLWQAKLGAVADTPDTPTQLATDALVIATPQKAIDVELRRPYHWWLDVQSSQWTRTDEAPLYNAMIHHAGFTPADDETPETSLKTNAHWQRQVRGSAVLRKVAALATQGIQFFASERDAEGRLLVDEEPLLYNALTQVVEKASITPAETLLAKIPQATLRADQAPILTYTHGTMAVSAVPGAGKTFVTVELILALIRQGVPPRSILVLTYMESAARTLLSRLKDKLNPVGISTLPMVSTIHALAFKLLTERQHASKVGIDLGQQPLQMVDDFQQELLIRQAALTTYAPTESGTGTDEKTWIRTVSTAIAQAKQYRLTSAMLITEGEHTQKPKLTQLGKAFEAYQTLLKESNQLDFTDLILLSVQLLEEHPDVRQYYQRQFTYIMEDEAQDSSPLLQRLLALLGGESPNIIRTGDTNQSITTTFSAADPRGFREFIQSATTSVQMTNSNRCALPIVALANHWLLTAPKHQPELCNAFLPTLLEGHPDKNPPLLEPITAQVFPKQADELTGLFEQVSRVQQAHPHASIAILTRSNNGAVQVAQYLQERGILALTQAEKLTVSPVFEVIEAYLKVLNLPAEAKNRIGAYRAFRLAELACVAHHDEETIEAIEAFLDSTPLFALPPEELPEELPFLTQWYYDFHDFNREVGGSQLAALILRISEQLFNGVINRSNGYLVALQANKALRHYGMADGAWQHTEFANRLAFESLAPLEVVLRYFAQAGSSVKTLKQFTEEALGLLQPTTANTEATTTPAVQVMTLHKSKGQEFEFVFIPFLTQREFPETLAQVRLKEPEMIAVRLNLLAQQLENTLAYNEATMFDAACTAQKRLVLEEEARLLYVGITRARQGLFLSAHETYKNQWHKQEKTMPTLLLRLVKDYLQHKEQPLPNE
jgi:DNA helicase-2/ATP-dependent DNA helicase PcrA